MALLDKNRRPLALGQLVRVCACVGRYGQTQIVDGRIAKLYEHHGATLTLTQPATWYGRDHREPRPVGAGFYVTFSGNWEGEDYVCHKVHQDFEHGHEAWVEILEA